MKLTEECCILVPLILINILIVYGNRCSLTIHGLHEKNSPVILQNYTRDFQLTITENGKINLNEEEKLTLICPDARNYLTATHSNTSYVSCVNGETLLVANKNVKFSDLQCKKIIRGDVYQTNKNCGTRGIIYKIGYRISPDSFINIIEVCYDAYVGQTLYTQHFLYGGDITHASKTTYRPSFSTEGLPNDVSASVAYKKPFQKSTFNKLLKSSLLSANYINEKSFLSRGHLSPDADFLFAAWKFTSYYYINAVPQWQIINNGNWKKIERLVRQVAGIVKDTLRIISGTFDVLTLTDNYGEIVPIYLVSGMKLPVSKYLWKIIYSENTREAIVLVILNNPFVDGINQNDLLCENICARYGWHKSSWLNSKSGFVHCCEYKEFIRVVQDAPKISVDGVLYGI